MNVKDRYSSIKYRDDSRSPWQLHCDSFQKLLKMCDVIASCRWSEKGIRQFKLTTFTVDAFMTTTKYNIATAEMLLSDHHFQYVLPASFGQDPLEKFFGNARQRCGGNFYIDITDVLAAAKVQRLHQLAQFDLFNQDYKHYSKVNIRAICEKTLDDVDLECIADHTIDDTEKFLLSDNTLKHKVIFIAGFMSRKFSSILLDNDDDAVDPTVSSEYTDELDRGGLLDQHCQQLFCSQRC